MGNEELDLIKLEGFNDIITKFRMGSISSAKEQTLISPNLKQLVATSSRVDINKEAETKKREYKAAEKAITKKAKDISRANRNDDMDFFAAYYTEKCSGQAFKALTRDKGLPTRLLTMFEDQGKRRKM